ncbi:MAG: MmcQ/YjbR family DNA-binding protein [Thermoplasmatota archaeon]|nr:MmcQ/YjbR family DNA-binding protein [Halobacteriales archaeon]
MPTQAAQQANATKKRLWDPAKVGRVRRICMGLPEVVEVEQFGEPWWKAGKKAFCSYGAEHLREGVAFNLTLLDQQQLCKQSRFEPTHYIGQHGWTTLTFGPKVDWDEVEDLIGLAYRKVANKRQLAALDEP